MWSIANEPRTQHRHSASYFKQIVQHTKMLDSTRPVTIALAQSPSVCCDYTTKTMLYMNIYL